MDAKDKFIDFLNKVNQAIEGVYSKEDELHQAQQLHKDLQAKMLEELESVLPGMVYSEAHRFVSDIYWRQGSGKEIKKIWKRVFGSIFTPSPVPTEYICQVCGKTLFADSISQLQSINDKGICKTCEGLRRAANNEVWDRERAHRLAAIENLRMMPYSEYLETDHWKEVRQAALKRSGFKCQLCNHSGELHVHHRTYENRGNERAADVIVLCKDCHQEFHDRMEIDVQ